MELYFEYPSYLIFVAVFVSAAISFLLYYKDKVYSSIKAWQKWLMTSLRFVFILIILLLLLNPIYKSKGVVVQKPIVVFVQDNSKSILLNKDSLYYQNEYVSQREDLLESFSDDYDVRYLQFSEFTSTDSILDYLGELSDVSSIFPEIVSRYAGMNLGAVIIASDGIYNRGINPIYSKNLNFPVYSIALGDTISQKDLILKDIMHNRIAFYGNRFPLRIFISAEKCIEKQSELLITREDKLIYSTDFSLPENSSVKSIEIELPADMLGVQQYDIKLKYLDDEISYENNVASFVMNVIDNRNKVLLLANAPHPDLGAIRYALKDNPDFEIEIEYISDFTGDISQYDLLILHQLPSNQNNAAKLFADIENLDIPILFVLGTSTSLTSFNNLDKGLQINSLSSNSDNAQAVFNQNFVSFSTGLDDKGFFENLSPLKVFFGEYHILGDSKVLLHQKVNGIKTDKPLILFVENQSTKTGFITGEGIWKWRIDDFKQHSNHDAFNTVINRIVQFLIIRKMQDKLLVEAKQVFNENEDVILNAEFYDESFELVPNLELELNLKNSEEQEFKYLFSNFGKAYRLDLGRVEAGTYTYTVNTSFDGKDYFATGEFIVQEINLEALNTKANHIILNQLAEMTGGKVFYPDNMSKISDDIHKNANVTSIAYEKEKLYTITDLFFLFFVILAFAATEWILRKYWGGY